MNGIIIKDLPMSNEVNDDDFLILDRYSGTKKIKTRNFKEFLADGIKVQGGSNQDDLLNGVNSVLKYRDKTIIPLTLASAVFMDNEGKTIYEVIDDLSINNTNINSELNTMNQSIDSVKEEVNEIKNMRLNTVKKTNRLDDCELAPLKMKDFTKGVVADLLFYVPDSKNQQGLSYAMDHFYVGFDIGSGNGEIIKYTKSGKKVSSTGSLVLGHCAEISFRESNGRFYVCNGGGSNLTKIYEVDFDNKRVIKTLDLSHLGTAALVTVNNDLDELILTTSLNGGDSGEITFSFTDYNGVVRKQFKIANQGVPQGLEYFNNIIYYYTNNRITCIDMDGNILGDFKINKKGESEGITICYDNGFPYLAVGYNGSNRIYSIRPYEAQKMVTPMFLNPFYSNSNPSTQLLPRMLGFALSFDYDTKLFSIANWANGVTDNIGGIIQRVENLADEVRVYLNVKFEAVAFFTGNADPQLLKDGIITAFNVEPVGNILSIKFVKDKVYQNLNSLPRYSDVRIFVCGGISYSY